MPRQPRFTLPGVAAHIVQRGNNRIVCFRDDQDHRVYLAILRELSGSLGCAVHAFCLMSNHVHLLLTPTTGEACSDLMRNLGQRYVQYFNRRHERTGTLWEGRFRSCVAQSARYVLACYRYIELNPVRAGMVSGPLAYPWSSHAVNSGHGTDSFVKPHDEYLALASDSRVRHFVYSSFFAAPFEPDLLAAIRDATNAGYPLGTEAFRSEVAATGRRVKRHRPGPAPQSGRQSSGSDPDLFSAGAASSGSRPGRPR